MQKNLERLAKRRKVKKVSVTMLIDEDILLAVDRKRKEIGITRTDIVTEAFKQFIEYRF